MRYVEKYKPTVFKTVQAAEKFLPYVADSFICRCLTLTTCNRKSFLVAFLYAPY